MRVALFILGMILVLTFGASFMAPYDPLATNTEQSLQPPSIQHLLGTDLLGRDVLSRVLFGGYRTLFVSAAATGIALIGGTLLGLLAVMWNKVLDSLVGIMLNSMLAVPGLLLSLVIITLLGRGMWQLALGVGVVQIAPFARIVRSEVLSIRNREYILGAYAIGGTRTWIMVHHILPNALPTLAAYTGVIFSYAIINSAALSFLGVGGDPSMPDWGTILADGRLTFQTAPWVSIAPGTMIVITVFSVNTLVDNLTGRRHII